MSELSCKFVSSHGILKSCKLTLCSLEQPNIPISVSQLEKGESLYLDANLVIPFYKKFWRYVKNPIVIVSGNQDINFDTMTDDITSLLKEEKLIKWFSQNMALEHPKCIQVPIGLDYHTLASHIGINHPWGKGMMPIIQESILMQIPRKEWQERHPAAFCNWHFFADRGDRKEVLQKADKKCLYLPQSYQQRTESWFVQAQFSFVCSPQGGGLDCHRSWEALCLGCVPIVKSSGMDSLWDGLPVWIVKDWSEVTLEMCVQKKQEFAEKLQEFNSPRLTLAYWLNLIRSGVEQVPA